MSWKRYQNELMIIGAFFLMFSMYVYKQNAVSLQFEEISRTTQVIQEIKEGITLKKVWSDKKIGKKVEKLKTIVPSSKVTWNKKSKKIHAYYKELKPSELNKLVNKILNTPVLIEKLDVQKRGIHYMVELKCRW